MTDRIDLRRALISVSDKGGLVEFAQALAARGVELLSTGGTAGALRNAGLDVRDVSEITGFPEMMDGRVKTLHPGVHGGLLALRDNAEHRASMEAHGIAPIDLLVVNLYPFEETVAKGAAYDDCIENIDIGGPAMIRSAAKNHAHVAVLTEPEQLIEVAREKSIRRAAEKLNLSASALSRQMQILEQGFGTPLFVRVPQGVRLTEPGEALLAQAQKWLDDETALRAAMRAPPWRLACRAQARSIASSSRRA